MQSTVLLVEADPPARDALRQTLEEAGYAVTEAANGVAALDLLRLNLSRKRPHRLVVLLSPSLPYLDGAEVLRAIAADPHLATHHAYVLLTPAQGPAYHIDEQALPTLTVAAMPQPCSKKELLDVVAHAASGLGMGSEGASRRD
jgi:two-component system chemotaxis response regulator CheY